MIAFTLCLFICAEFSIFVDIYSVDSTHIYFSTAQHESQICFVFNIVFLICYREVKILTKSYVLLTLYNSYAIFLTCRFSSLFLYGSGDMTVMPNVSNKLRNTKNTRKHPELSKLISLRQVINNIYLKVFIHFGFFIKLNVAQHNLSSQNSYFNIHEIIIQQDEVF